MNYSTLYQYCQEVDVPCISHPTRDRLMAYLRIHKPQYIVEIGSAAGYSGLLMSNEISAWDGSVISREFSRPQYKKCLYHQSIFHQYHNLQFYHVDATHSVHRNTIVWSYAPLGLDFAFVDGSKAQYHQFVTHLIPHMIPGKSSIICDDVITYHDKITPLYEYLDRKQIQYHITPLADDDGVMVISL
jgi:predicted O-methyltransferase YrrM